MLTFRPVVLLASVGRVFLFFRLFRLRQFLFDNVQRFGYAARGWLQRQAFEPVRQGHRGYGIDVFRCDLFHPKICCVGLRWPANYDVSTMSVYVEFDVDESDEFGNVTRNSDSLLYLGGSRDAGAQCLFGGGIFSEKRLWRGLEAFAQFDNLNTLLNVVNGGDIDAESKAIGKLRAYLTLFGIHRPDHHQTCRVPQTNSFPFT